MYKRQVLLSCISKIDSRQSLDEDYEFKLEVKEFADLFNLPHGSTYQYIKEGADKLSERTFKYRNDKEQFSAKINWTSQVKYYDDEGSIGICFGNKAIPFLTSLRENFTSYRLANIVNLTSVYSIRLYEMLLQWRKIGKVTFTMESFRESMGIKKTEYKRMFDFKKKVLNIAVNQINQNTDINCNYIEVKKGRKITGLEFHFGKYQATQIELEETIKEIQALKGRPE